MSETEILKSFETTDFKQIAPDNGKEIEIRQENMFSSDNPDRLCFKIDDETGIDTGIAQYLHTKKRTPEPEKFSEILMSLKQFHVK